MVLPPADPAHDVRTASASSRAIATPSSAAAPRRVRAPHALRPAPRARARPALRWPELGVQQALERPDGRDDRHAHVSHVGRRNASNASTSNTGLVTANSAPASTLYSKRRTSSSSRGDVGFTITPIVKRRRLADRLAADVAPVVQPRDDVGQADRVDVEHQRRVRVVAELARIAGDAASRLRTPIACAPSRSDCMPSRLRSRQEYCSTVSMPAVLLDEHRQRQRAHPRAAAAAPSGTVISVDAVRGEARAHPRARRPASCPLRRHQLDGDDAAGLPPARAPARDFVRARRPAAHRRSTAHRAAAPAAARRAGAGRQRLHREPDLPDVLGRRAAAAADQPHAALRRSAARTTPCIPASTDRCCGLRCRAACRRWAAPTARASSTRADAARSSRASARGRRCS